MRLLAKQHVLPHSLCNLPALPLCPSCAFGGCKRRPWRTKDKHGSIRKADHSSPGFLVCTDQLVSSQPGLVPRSSGCLTTSLIWACNVFLDVHAGYCYGYMMRSTSLDQTVAAKCAFESKMVKHNVKVKEHRADNERFADLGFKLEVEKCNQKITYCGVGAHGQNGIIERHIGKITVRRRIMLLHAKHF